MIDSKSETQFCHHAEFLSSKPNVVAFSTTRHFPELARRAQLPLSKFAKAAFSDVNSVVDQNNGATNKELVGFDAFNLGLHVNDDSNRVKRHREQLQWYLPTQCKIQWLNQVHGNGVVDVDVVSDHPITADASYTNKKNIALAIMTADCLPIIISSQSGNEIGAIHGGWRCLAGGIIERTLEKFDAVPSELSVWLGPCIGAQAFEVGADVHEKFLSQSIAHESAFDAIEGKADKYLADLQQIAKQQFNSLGVKDICVTAECTYQRANKYYSYRRNSITGRMATIVALT